MRTRSTVLITAALVSLLLFSSSCTKTKTKFAGAWETTNGNLRIKIAKYVEQGGFVAGAFYQFEAAPSGSGWREIMVFRHDDPVEIPKDNVRFVSDEVAYVFMGWKYAVTIDGGHTWSVWDGTKSGVSGCCSYIAIKELSIAVNGFGIMSLETSPRPTVVKLTTKDFGQHWAM